MQGIRLNLVSECPQKPTFRRLSSEEEGTAMHFAWSRGGGGAGWGGILQGTRSSRRVSPVLRVVCILSGSWHFIRRIRRNLNTVNATCKTEICGDVCRNRLQTSQHLEQYADCQDDKGTKYLVDWKEDLAQELLLCCRCCFPTWCVLEPDINLDHLFVSLSCGLNEATRQKWYTSKASSDFSRF